MRKIKQFICTLLLTLILCMIGGIAIVHMPLKVQAATQTSISIGTPKLVSVKSLGESKAQIKWVKVKKASGYKIYRKTYNTKWKLVKAINNGSATSYTDNGLKSGTKYYYTVRAYRKTGNKTISGKYNTKGIYVVTDLQIPTLTKISALSHSEIQLSWNKTVNTNGYYIFRRKNANSDWELLATIEDGNVLQYTDSTCVDATKYYYTIQAYTSVDNIVYKSKFKSNGWGCTTKSMPVKDAIEIETIETQSSIFVKGYNKSKNYYSALDMVLELYDSSGKIVYRSEYGTAFYHIRSGRTFYTLFSKPQNSKKEYIEYSYYKIVPKPFGTINYRDDIFDKIEIVDIQKDTNNVSVKLQNTTDEVVFYGEVIFLFYKNEQLIHCASSNFRCNVYEECETNTETWFFKDGKRQYIDCDDVQVVISRAFVTY